MADIITRNDSAKKAGVRRSVKLSTRVDLTPMVDLGFLLITFFIFTTNISQPTGMSLVLPADGDSSKTAEGKTLNLVLSANNRVIYYMGNDLGNRGCADFSPQGIRKAILQVQNQVKQRYGAAEELVVLIRPTVDASYLNIVDILDEMVILNVKKYALMDDSPADRQLSLTTRKPC